jgi:hypothetical protein
MSLELFRVGLGLSIDGSVIVRYGSTDPTTSTGVVANKGSLYAQTSNGDLWHKTGTGDTAWTKFTDGSSIPTDDAYQNTFMGKTSLGSELPDYSSSIVISDGDDLRAAIGKLDAVAIYKKKETNKNISSGYTADTIAVTDLNSVEWMVTIRQTSTPTNISTRKVIAVTDGSLLDYTVFAANTLGTAISSLNITVDISGGTIRLRLTGSAIIDYSLTRLTTAF